MTVDRSRPDRVVSRVGKASAAYYFGSRQVMLAADDFESAKAALAELDSSLTDDERR